MDDLALRIAVNMFDPIGVIIPALLIYVLFRKQKLFWIWVSVLVAAWKGGFSFLLDPGMGLLMVLAGFLGGAFWAWIFRLFQTKNQPSSDI